MINIKCVQLKLVFYLYKGKKQPLFLKLNFQVHFYHFKLMITSIGFTEPKTKFLLSGEEKPIYIL